ncbi:hypothetical protein MYSTI_07183 [Myxococcus stipitatus DSM 14675]|uniref:DUF1622 domain-containing protein n=1 Tax=Myxococcus stipitatus (strain DSM 14675 / JCM 12634 / Mx s8) TaxID=1278073 RepID=L7UKP6_MYXSD|nr:DUF1622 domain-containing protein [Myxococcus stipitatus]AGC48455.1 hypothetical protein MYSTI_07183 [Myxococcus stipitatus DSM 14675]
MDIRPLISLSARLMELAGVGSMVLGALLGTGLLLFRRQGLSAPEAYRRFRLNLGRAILLGLEFLVAADIIRTVSDQPTLSGVLVLGVIVLIRTFLSFTLTVELEGRWPWQPERKRPATTPPALPPPPGKLARPEAAGASARH